MKANVREKVKKHVRQTIKEMKLSPFHVKQDMGDFTPLNVECDSTSYSVTIITTGTFNNLEVNIYEHFS